MSDNGFDVICHCAGCGEPIRLGDMWVVGEDGTYCEGCVESSRDAAELAYLLALDERAPAGPGPGGRPNIDGPADPEVEPW